MNKISVVSFIRNEEKNIDAWLSSLKPHVDEILIYDLESTDNTFNLCKKYTENVFRRPFLLCGDSYKMELIAQSKNNWLLWTYPDERFPEYTVSSLNKLINAGTAYNVFAFMRHEYMDDVRIQYNDTDGKIIAYGTPDNPNYQRRLIKKDPQILNTELVHFEVFGNINECTLPPELNMEHWKTSTDQEFDNIRLYVWCKYLIWKYGETQIEPYRTYINSYKTIVADSEKLNEAGKRRVHPAEEEWWDWKKYCVIDKDIKFVNEKIEDIKNKEV